MSDRNCWSFSRIWSCCWRRSTDCPISRLQCIAESKWECGDVWSCRMLHNMALVAYIGGVVRCMLLEEGLTSGSVLYWCNFVKDSFKPCAIGRKNEVCYVVHIAGRSQATVPHGTEGVKAIPCTTPMLVSMRHLISWWLTRRLNGGRSPVVPLTARYALSPHWIREHSQRHVTTKCTRTVVAWWLRPTPAR